MTDNNQNQDFLNMIFSTDEDYTETDTFGVSPEIELDGFLEEPMTEPKPIVRFLKKLLPWKGDSVREIIRKSIFIIAVAVFIGTGIYLVNYILQGGVNKGLVDNARAVYDIGNSEKNEDGIFTRFEELIEQNDDVRGWVKIDGTRIDYPVYQAHDNDFYIDHDMSRQSSRYGAIFADSSARIRKKGNSKNIVLYGHNMLDGSMFSQLLDYKSLDFYRKNPLISFDTVYNEGSYKVFAVFIINAEAKDDDGYIFNYRKNIFPERSSFRNFIAEAEARSIINTGVEVRDDDEILTLSTCSYEFDNARTVVMARKVREGESLHISTSKAKTNKQPLYPQAYYDKHGGKKPKLDFDFSEENGVEKVEGDALKGYSGPSGVVYTTEDIISVPITEEVEVPGLIDMSLSDAVKLINQKGLYIDNIEYDKTNTEENVITAQSLEAGRNVLQGSPITLSVTGKAKELIVPNLVGMDRDAAIEKAGAAGFTLRFAIAASKKEAGAVLMQSIIPTSETKKRSILIYVSNGQNKIPKLIGRSLKSAQTLIEDAGFEVKLKYIETVNKAQVGFVCAQSPMEGEFMDLGDKLTITVGKASTKDPYTANPDIYTPSPEDLEAGEEDDKKDKGDKDKDKDKGNKNDKDEDKKPSKDEEESEPEETVSSSSSEVSSEDVSSSAEESTPSSEVSSTAPTESTVPSAPSDTSSEPETEDTISSAPSSSEPEAESSQIS